MCMPRGVYTPTEHRHPMRHRFLKAAFLVSLARVPQEYGCHECTHGVPM